MAYALLTCLLPTRRESWFHASALLGCCLHWRLLLCFPAFVCYEGKRIRESSSPDKVLPRYFPLLLGIYGRKTHRPSGWQQGLYMGYIKPVCQVYGLAVDLGLPDDKHFRLIFYVLQNFFQFLS